MTNEVNKTHNAHPYKIGVITEDYINLSGELIAQAGAAGLIVGEHNGRLTMAFDNDNSDKQVALDGGGRKTQSIPSYYVDRLFDGVTPTFEQVKNGYKHALLRHLLHSGDVGALKFNDNEVALLMDNNQNVGFIPLDEIGVEEPMHYLASDWDESVGNWRGYAEPHSADFQSIPIVSYGELVEQINLKHQTSDTPKT